MELTRSWQDVFSEDLQGRYSFAETRNAAGILAATDPEALQDLIDVLEEFTLSVDLLVRAGGNKSRVAWELDEAFRDRGWREARFEQSLTTTLRFFPWRGAGERVGNPSVESENHYGGHKVDNVRNRAVVDVEWNPKDGNLDRDLGNYVSLHEGGVIDVGVLVVRERGGLRDHTRNLIADVREISRNYPSDSAWQRRLAKVPDDPFGTSTTANFERLVTRLERGDGRGCPVLAVGIGMASYFGPHSLEEEVQRLACEEDESTRDG